MSPRNPHHAAAPSTPAVALQREPARVEFALWDDGRLSIYDGDEIQQIDPADTERLARLLGGRFQQPATA